MVGINRCAVQPSMLSMSNACRMDPLWNSIVVAGVQDDKPFLGMISMLGVHFSDDHIATGTFVIFT